MLQLGSQHRTRERIRESAVLNKTLHHGHEVGKLLDLVDEDQRLARNEGLVSHEREACYEIRYIGGLSQRALRRLIEVEIDCQKALILLATQALYQIAFTDLARTCHEKCCLTTSGRPNAVETRRPSCETRRTPFAAIVLSILAGLFQ